MSKTRTAKISSLTPDPKNLNKGTERGQRMLEDSLRKYGAGRSILLDKNGVVIAGNKTLENAAQLGMEDVIIVPSDGKKIIAVQRTDLDMNEPQAKALALADNRVAEVDLQWDALQLKDISSDLDLMEFWKPDELSRIFDWKCNVQSMRKSLACLGMSRSSQQFTSGSHSREVAFCAVEVYSRPDAQQK